MIRPLQPLLCSGRYFEAPRWQNGRLWLVDCLERTVLAVRAPDDVKVMAHLEDIPAGLGFLPTGEGIVTGMFRRALFRCSAEGPTLYADLSRVASGTIDDMIVDRVGRAYVGDLGLNLLATSAPPDDPCGRLILVEPSGGTRVVAEGLRFPNGMAVSEDGRQLIVAESAGNTLARFAVADDGSLELLGRFGRVLEPDVQSFGSQPSSSTVIVAGTAQDAGNTRMSGGSTRGGSDASGIWRGVRTNGVWTWKVVATPSGDAGVGSVFKLRWTDAATVHAATTTGYWKSLDAGQTWTASRTSC